MDPYSLQNTPPVEEDEWDTDGFVIPSLGIEEQYQNIPEVKTAEAPAPSKTKTDRNIYLGPHGAPPSQSKEQESNSASLKQRLKLKLRDGDGRRVSGSGRENLKELLGAGKGGRVKQLSQSNVFRSTS